MNKLIIQKKNNYAKKLSNKYLIIRILHTFLIIYQDLQKQ